MLNALRTAVMMLAFISFNAFAAKSIYTGWFSNKAVSGYDTVAYFTQNKPVRGNARFKYEFKGVEWYFSSEEHLKMFKAAPKKYMPQYGGFCAWAIAEKKSRAASDPNFWKILNGKLYLNYDKNIQEKWLKDIPGFIKAADKNWPEMQ